MEAFNVKTEIMGDCINQTVTNGIRTVSEQLMDTKSDGVRMALLRLGWFPPTSARRDDSMRYVYHKDTYWYVQIPASGTTKKKYIGCGKGATFLEACAVRDKYLADNNLPPIE